MLPEGARLSVVEYSFPGFTSTIRRLVLAELDL